MNWSFSSIEGQNHLKVSIQGDFTLEDCVKIKEDFLSKDFWKPGLNILYDYRQTNFDNNLTLDDLRDLGIFHESKNELIGSGRMAFLMKSPRDFGLARQYEMITEGKVLSEIRVFLNEEKAIEWVTYGSIDD